MSTLTALADTTAAHHAVHHAVHHPAVHHLIHHRAVHRGVHHGVHHAHRRRLRSAPFDYAGMALGAFLSWVGVPGPGEPLLVAAGLLASRGKLDLGTLLLAAWIAATLGGVIGWVVGLKAGRALVTFRGPFRTARIAALERGEAVFTRFAPLAVLLTPSWIAGINGVRPALYLPMNALGAALWTALFGLGAYLAGPTVLDIAGDLGTITLVVLVVLTVVGVAFGRRRRRRARAARARDGA